MFTNEISVAAMQLGCVGLLWAAAYTVLARLIGIDMVPSVLHARVLRTRSLVPYVAGFALLLLVFGATASS